MAPGDSVVEAIGRALHGETEAIGTAEEQIKASLVAELPRLSRLPALAEQIASQAARGDLRARVSLFSGERDVRVVSTLLNRFVLGVVGGLVLIGSGVFATARSSSAQVIGYVGVGMAGLLLLRVVAVIVRDGLN